MQLTYTLIFIYNFFIFEEQFTAAESTILAAGLTVIYAFMFYNIDKNKHCKR